MKDVIIFRNYSGCRLPGMRRLTGDIQKYYPVMEIHKNDLDFFSRVTQ